MVIKSQCTEAASVDEFASRSGGVLPPLVYSIDLNHHAGGVTREAFMIQLSLRKLGCSLSLALGLLLIPGCASGPAPVATGVKMEPAALAVLKSMSDKLGSAQTVQVEAEHKLDRRLGIGSGIDQGSIELAVKRPNQFYAIQPAGLDTREIAYDGTTLCVMHPGRKHHALETLPSKNIEGFAQLVDERFGFRPPVAELLASDAQAELLFDVTSVQLLGSEHLGWTRCDHLQLGQPGMTVELWIGTADHLPRRMLMTTTDIKGHPTWNVRFTKWKLNEPLNESLFSKRPAPDSQKAPMVKSR